VWQIEDYLDGGGGGEYPIHPTATNKEISSVLFLFLSMTKLLPEGEEGANGNEESEKRDGVTWNISRQKHCVLKGII
jgi:hypothetical protein